MRCFILILLLFALPVRTYASSCYSMQEVAAEQGIRIHSELMVISLNCQHIAHKRGNLYILFRDFTRKHQSLLSQYERRLISFYQRQGLKNPERKIHHIRTEMANKVAQDIAQMRPDLFCRAYSDRVPDSLALTTQQVKQWAETLYPQTVLNYPICEDAKKGYNKG